MDDILIKGTPITDINTHIEDDFADAKQYAVLIHNDNITSAEFVTFILMEVFEKSIDEALQIMLEVHNSDNPGVAGTYSSIDETYEKVDAVENLKKEYKQALLITVEEVE